jgi:hypothetical protein
MYALMQLVLAAQVNARLLRIAPWQLELLVYGYQVGSLVVPTLAPILVWLWLTGGNATNISAYRTCGCGDTSTNGCGGCGCGCN